MPFPVSSVRRAARPNPLGRAPGDRRRSSDHDVTYESFAGAWPEREQAGEDDAEFAKQLGDKLKYVLSSRKLAFSWRNSEQLEGDLVEAVTALKEEEGDIFLSGSPTVVRQVVAEGLLSSEVFPTGMLHLVYAPDPTPPAGGYEEAVEAAHLGVLTRASAGRKAPGRRTP